MWMGTNLEYCWSGSSCVWDGWKCDSSRRFAFFLGGGGDGLSLLSLLSPSLNWWAPSQPPPPFAKLFFFCLKNKLKLISYNCNNNTRAMSGPSAIFILDLKVRLSCLSLCCLPPRLVCVSKGIDLPFTPNCCTAYEYLLYRSIYLQQIRARCWCGVITAGT